MNLGTSPERVRKKEIQKEEVTRANPGGAECGLLENEREHLSQLFEVK